MVLSGRESYKHHVNPISDNTTPCAMGSEREAVQLRGLPLYALNLAMEAQSGAASS
jgi:hypothetical protein